MTLPRPLVVRRATARRFLRQILGFDAPHRDVGAALAHHGYIQIDPINVCGRMHDLILRNRVVRYREGGLHEFLHSAARPGFEHYLLGQGILAAFPLDAWPYLLGRMRARTALRHTHSGRLTPREQALAQHILSEIAARGPLTSDDIAHDGRARSAWGVQGSLAKRVLEKLFSHGRVLITARRGFRRVYDLSERVLPAAVLAQPPRPEPEVARWVVLTKLRQRRLAALTRAEHALVPGEIQPVTIADAECAPLACLREDAPLLAAIENRQPPRADPPPPPLLLAPLDPLIYDRRVTSALWDFNYTWEAYTPPARRVRGYYALPVLAGLELTGHVEPRADRPAGRLTVISRRVRGGVRLAPALGALAGWLQLRR